MNTGKGAEEERERVKWRKEEGKRSEGEGGKEERGLRKDLVGLQ